MENKKDILWAAIWGGVVLFLGVWNFIFLNRPAFKLICLGFWNTLLMVLIVVFISLVMAWGVTLLINKFESKSNKMALQSVLFVLNLIRSIPQIVGVLMAYIFIAGLVQQEVLVSAWTQFPLMAFLMSLFIFSEMVDLMRERINHFKKLDFFNAMSVCGISQWRIINFDILWKNSRIHILNKLISFAGIAVFLQCSVDFIISVGLSTEVSRLNLPTTLGSILAKIDSKQDVLAIGYTLTHPVYFFNLFFKHLQGLTVAFIIVFTLLSVFKISNGLAERVRRG